MYDSSSTITENSCDLYVDPCPEDESPLEDNVFDELSGKSLQAEPLASSVTSSSDESEEPVEADESEERQLVLRVHRMSDWGKTLSKVEICVPYPASQKSLENFMTLAILQKSQEWKCEMSDIEVYPLLYKYSLQLKSSGGIEC